MQTLPADDLPFIAACIGLHIAALLPVAAIGFFSAMVRPCLPRWCRACADVGADSWGFHCPLRRYSAWGLPMEDNRQPTTKRSESGTVWSTRSIHQRQQQQQQQQQQQLWSSSSTPTQGTQLGTAIVVVWQM